MFLSKLLERENLKNKSRTLDKKLGIFMAIIKVWCDMSTDGGGFMLIGRKNNSITWSVPSNNKPVDPYGEPHWTSSLGKAPILDFRVQVATSKDFKTTKARW